MKSLVEHFEEHDRRIFWILVCIFAIGLVSYIYFLSMSVHAVVARKHAEATSERLLTRIALLESQYVTIDGRINLGEAHERGFVDIAPVKYLSTKEVSKTLTLREGR